MSRGGRLLFEAANFHQQPWRNDWSLSKIYCVNEQRFTAGSREEIKFCNQMEIQQRNVSGTKLI